MLLTNDLIIIKTIIILFYIYRWLSIYVKNLKVLYNNIMANKANTCIQDNEYYYNKDKQTMKYCQTVKCSESEQN